MPERLGIGTAMLALSLAVPAPAGLAQGSAPAADGSPWRMVLEQQLQAEKACDLLEVLLFDEFKSGEETVLEGKISCVDGRKFDFHRRNQHLKFKLDLCEPAVC